MKNIILLCLTLFLISGCGPRYQCQIDSLSAPHSFEGKTYVLLPSDKNVSPNDLQFIEFATYVVRVLNSKGMRYAQDSEIPDLAIFVGYGISAPHTSTRVVSTPVWGKTGVSSSHTYGSINSYGNYGTYSGTTTYTPTYGVTGYAQHTETDTNYTRYLWLTAYDHKEYQRTKRNIQVWKTSVMSSGTSGDLRQVFPIMLGGALGYIGTNTGKLITVDISGKDDKVEFVKGIKK